MFRVGTSIMGRGGGMRGGEREGWSGSGSYVWENGCFAYRVMQFTTVGGIMNV